MIMNDKDMILSFLADEEILKQSALIEKEISKLEEVGADKYKLMLIDFILSMLFAWFLLLLVVGAAFLSKSQLLLSLTQFGAAAILVIQGLIILYISKVYGFSYFIMKRAEKAALDDVNPEHLVKLYISKDKYMMFESEKLSNLKPLEKKSAYLLLNEKKLAAERYLLLRSGLKAYKFLGLYNKDDELLGYFTLDYDLKEEDILE